MAKAFPLLTINSAGTMADNAAMMLHIRLAEMLHFARHVDDPQRVAELHNMRIAAKRLRYTMELFLPYVEGQNGKSLSNLLDRTKKVQEMIGEIHDRDVRVPLILQFTRKNESKRPEIRSGLIALAQQEQDERRKLYDELLAYWREQQAKYVARMMTLIAALSVEAAVGDPVDVLEREGSGTSKNGAEQNPQMPSTQQASDPASADKTPDSEANADSGV